MSVIILFETQLISDKVFAYLNLKEIIFLMRCSKIVLSNLYPINQNILRNLSYSGSISELIVFIEMYNVHLRACDLSKLVCLENEMNRLLSRNNMCNISSLTWNKDIEVSSTSIFQISQLNRLFDLNLTDCRISDEELVQTSELTNLAVLNLSKCKKITDNGLRHLSTLTNLTSLNLSQCSSISDAGMVHIAHLRNLSLLDLSRCNKITVIGLVHLFQLPNVTDGGLLTNLKYLNLSECDVIDAGLLTSILLRQYANPKILQQIRLSCTGRARYSDREFGARGSSKRIASLSTVPRPPNRERVCSFA